MTDISERQLVTNSRLQRELRSLGVASGMVLIVHSSLSSLGWVCGGAQTVIEAIEPTTVVSISERQRLQT